MDMETRRGECTCDDYNGISLFLIALRVVTSSNINLSSLQSVAGQGCVDIDLCGVHPEAIGAITTIIMGNGDSNNVVVLCDVGVTWLLVPTCRAGENAVSWFFDRPFWLRKTVGIKTLFLTRINQLWSHRCVAKSLTPHIITSVFNISTDIMCKGS